MIDLNNDSDYEPGDIYFDVQGNQWLKMKNGAWALIFEEETNTTEH